ncbi:hypothetical protein [Streptomyces nigrescens]|uniref:hypothetical protein n=1 Tax=Streptomyces nigrescens TaxID=1920 RepID=UPI0036FEE56C
MRQAMHRLLHGATQNHRRQCVEVVLSGEEVHRRDALQLGSTTGGGCQQFPARKLDPCLPDAFALLLFP